MKNSGCGSSLSATAIDEVWRTCSDSTAGSPPPSERGTLAANFEGTVRARRSTNTNGLQQTRCNPLILLAEWTGLEPATPGVTGRYSNQLNYHSMFLQGPVLTAARCCRYCGKLASPRGFEPL